MSNRIRGLNPAILITSFGLIIYLCFYIFPVSASASADDATCLDCHEEMAATLKGTSHWLGSQLDSPNIIVSCLNCHQQAEAHLEEPSRETMKTPGEMMAYEEVRICTQCHTTHVELDNYGYDIHSIQELGCHECHNIHGGYQSLLLSERTTFCFKCHENKKTTFNKASNHPILEMEMDCLSCHCFVIKQDDRLALQFGSLCRDCHPEQAGPFPYEHEAVNAYAVEGSGCIECHRPHGSENDRLLTQPRERLCRQCHMTPPGHLNGAYHGFVWADYQDCSLCHSAVHGSFDNRLFLDPNLPVKFGVDCYQSECHDINSLGRSRK